MKKLMVIIFAIALGAINATATLQESDWVYYNGKSYRLYSNPMEEYFNKYQEKKPVITTGSSSLDRGYVAFYTIADQVISLKDLEIETYKKTKSGGGVFGRKSVINDLVPFGCNLDMSWFSDVLVLSHGDLIVNIGYSNFILLDIESGILTREKRFTAEQYKAFKAKQYETFKKTESYKIEFDKLGERGISLEFRDDIIQRNISEFTDIFLEEPCLGEGNKKVVSSEADKWLQHEKNNVVRTPEQKFIEQLNAFDPTDEDIDLFNRLIGTWVQTNSPKVIMHFEYKKDGTYTSFLEYVPDPYVSHEFGGNWQIKNSHLIKTITYGCENVINKQDMSVVEIRNLTNKAYTYHFLGKSDITALREGNSNRVHPAVKMPVDSGNQQGTEVHP